jgi:hypothetical protein
VLTQDNNTPGIALDTRQAGCKCIAHRWQWMTPAPAAAGSPTRTDPDRPMQPLGTVVAQCPCFRGDLLRFDAAKSKAIPGVLEVFDIPTDPHSANKSTREVAVVATNTWAAIQGRNALGIEWKPGQYHDESTESHRTATRRPPRSGVLQLHQLEPQSRRSPGRPVPEITGRIARSQRLRDVSMCLAGVLLLQQSSPYAPIHSPLEKRGPTR